MEKKTSREKNRDVMGKQKGCRTAKKIKKRTSISLFLGEKDRD